MYQKALFIFRRDLRLDDNTALLAALANAREVICAFIFDPRQIDESNPYRGEKLLQFMAQSQHEVDEALKKHNSQLYFFEGLAHDVVKQLIGDENVEAVYVNRDYTSFSQERDGVIEEVCEKNGAAFHSYDDYTLNPPEAVKKDDGKPYTVFTPYYKKAMFNSIAKPKKNTKTNYYTKSISFSTRTIYDRLRKLHVELYVDGGRSVALSILKQADSYSNYKSERDFPAIKGTTGLSAHHKFGTISMRESYYAFEHIEPLKRQLYWHDFFIQIAYYFPKVFGHAYQDKFDKVKWTNDKKLFTAWCEGKTGYPIVDAGMRELVTTGYMHNRTRMIVASFLTKDLHIDWQWGEKFFAQHLIDYDPCVNNGSWQWAASTGTDAQPYFRIFNPWLQQKRFDPDCVYIKKWVPELADLDAKAIHKLDEQHPLNIDYPKPIVDHKTQKEIALALFTSL